jgi:hypothetical protein
MVEQGALPPDRPFAVDRPMTEAQPVRQSVPASFVEDDTARRREMLRASIAEIRLRRPQVVPVGLRLHAEPFDIRELTLDSEQLLDESLRLVVSSFAEVLIADHSVWIDEVERRPIVIVECSPDFIVVVDHDRIIDRSFLRRQLHPVDLVLEGELRRMDSKHDQPVIAVGLRPRPDVRFRA